MDHKKAQLWLLLGGHVEIDEDPEEPVRRECHSHYKFDPHEFNEIKWFYFNEILYKKSKTHRHQFINKLTIL